MVPPTLRRCVLLAAATFVVCLPAIHSAVQWPKPVDEYDQHLITLARSRRQVADEDLLTTTAAPDAKKNTTKNLKIDWAEVEANWTKVLTEEEVKKKWDAMETNTKNGESEWSGGLCDQEN